jgi:uncharacterized damage-inducible protein DinB
MTTPPMLRQIRHDVWATEHLLERCRALSAEQLELTVAGTYGTIRRTLGHIVGADESYLARLGIAVADPFGPGAGASLADVTAHFADVKATVERIFSEEKFSPDRVMPTRRGPIRAWVLVTQFVHHGSDHRAHIGTILGAHGLDVPELDVWTYAGTVGGFTDD